MPDLDSGTERLLRSIARRRRLRGFAFALPVIVAWLLLSRWVTQRWGVQPYLARFVSVLVFAVAAIVAPRWLGGNPIHDPRETPRLRWLGRERADRKIGGRSIIAVFGFGLALLGQCLIVLGSGSTNADLSGSDILLWSILGMVLGLRWRPADLGDEGAHARYLIAVNRAFLVTLVACLAAIVLDSCWGGGRLRHLLEAALLIGCMTLRLSLIIDERRAAAESE